MFADVAVAVVYACTLDIAAAKISAFWKYALWNAFLNQGALSSMNLNCVGAFTILSKNLIGMLMNSL